MKNTLLLLVTILFFVEAVTAQQVSIISSPVGHDGNANGYIDSPIEFQGVTYFRYLGNDGNHDLAKYQNGMMIIIPSPTGYDNSTGGYVGSPIVVNNVLYLRYKSNGGGNQKLAKYDGNTLTIIPNLSGYAVSNGYQGSPHSDGNNLFLPFQNDANGNNDIIKYDGASYTNMSLASHSCQLGSGITVNGITYFRYQTSSYYVLAKTTGSTMTAIANPANHNNSGMGYIGQAVEYNGALYMRYRNNSGQGNLAKYDGSTLTLINSPFNHSYLLSSATPYVWNNKLYMKYSNALGNWYLCEYNGTTLTEITSPTGYQNASKGYLGEPYAIDTILYLRYLENGGNAQLAKYNGTTLTVIPSPAGYENANVGYEDFPIALGSTLVVRYKDNSSATILATFNNGSFTFYPISGTQYVNFGNPILLNSAIYTMHTVTGGSLNLAKFDGITNSLITNPSTHNTTNNGYLGLPFISNGQLLMRYRGNDGNYDLARLLNCSTTTTTIVEDACFSYTAPDGMVYTTSNTYTAIIPNAAGCDSIITINLTITDIDTTVTLNGTTLTATQAGATYQWVDCNNGNAAISGETSQSFTPLVSGNYAVAIDNNGCTDISVCTAVTVVGIKDLQTNNSFNIYPNPATNQLSIETSETIVTKQIIDLNGRVVYTENDDKTTIQIANLPTGVYFIKLHTEKGVYQQKFVKN